MPGDSVYIVWEGFARLSRLLSRSAEKLLTILQAQMPEGSLTPYSICIIIRTYVFTVYVTVSSLVGMHTCVRVSTLWYNGMMMKVVVLYIFICSI